MVSSTKVVILTTGGTFAMREPNRADAGTAVIRGFQITWPCEVAIEDFVAVGSSQLTLAVVQRLAVRLEDILRQANVAGVVLTHGTATLEETAYYLSLVLESEKPVVVTGAMRRPSELSSDAPRNLRDAVMAAQDSRLAAAGTMVLMNGELHDPALVRKCHTKMVDGFESPSFGPFGWVDGDDVHLMLVTRRHRTLPNKRLEASVQLIRTVIDQDDVLVKACTKEAVDGIVLEALGGGFMPPRLREAVRSALNDRIFVVVTPRCGAGSIIRQEAFEASLSTEAARYLSYSNIPGHKERLKLIALLSHTKRPEEVGAWFDVWVGARGSV